MEIVCQRVQQQKTADKGKGVKSEAAKDAPCHQPMLFSAQNNSKQRIGGDEIGALTAWWPSSRKNGNFIKFRHLKGWWSAWPQCETNPHERVSALCSYRKQLGISEILKSNGPDFAQFWFKFDNFTFGWCKTVKRIQEKYFLQIFVINGSYISKKHE